MSRVLSPLVTVVAIVALAGSAVAHGVLPTLLGNSINGPFKLLVRPAQIVPSGGPAEAEGLDDWLGSKPALPANWLAVM